MKNILLSVVAFSILNLGLVDMFAQGAISSNGNKTNVELSGNQVAYSGNKSTSGSFEKKEVYTLEFSVVSGVDETENIELKQLENPNSTGNYFSLGIDTFEDKDINTFSFQVYDLNGKLRESENITNKKTIIPMQDMSPDSYLIMVFKDNQAIKIFKVAKK